MLSRSASEGVATAKMIVCRTCSRLQASPVFVVRSYGQANTAHGLAYQTRKDIVCFTNLGILGLRDECIYIKLVLLYT
jgi:hypothetical protein